MFDEGVIDAIKVSRAAPESAASIARAAHHHRTAVVEQVVATRCRHTHHPVTCEIN
jgi:hypothetical protein